MMKKMLLILLLFCVVGISYSQVNDTIKIKNIAYVITIDTLTHKIDDVTILDEETLFENIYIGFSTPVRYANLTPTLLWDCSEYGKFGLGYDMLNKTITISAYIGIGRLDKRRDKVNTIYF